jgi:hypothetical protein
MVAIAADAVNGPMPFIFIVSSHITIRMASIDFFSYINRVKCKNQIDEPLHVCR